MSKRQWGRSCQEHTAHALFISDLAQDQTRLQFNVNEYILAMSEARSSGLLLHITSLSGGCGVGDLGPEAYRFVDFLARAGQRYWQVLPLGPVGAGASPYDSPSAFAGNPVLISLQQLVEDGLLKADELTPAAAFPNDHVDYHRTVPFKKRLLTRAFERFERQASADDRHAFEAFRAEQSDWLGDYTLFMALKEATGGAPWTAWEPALARREEEALDRARAKHERTTRKYAFWQHLFARQWQALRAYAHERGVRFFGDLPLYVAHDSADVWAHQHLFQLDERGQPTAVAGVPPDYFSETGQRWGNPLYRWERMEERDFAWWTRRFTAVLRRVDLLRLDHFRGFEAYWAVPASADTAAEGRWIDGPGRGLFEHLEQALGELPLVAEDLGTITPAVRTLIEAVDIPGMAVLSFGLQDGPSSTFLPHHYRRRLVAYTGTHDNAPLAGWYTDADPGTRAFARSYLGLENGNESLSWRAMRLLIASVAERTIFPLQDVLGLGNEARMNTPGRPAGNWRWRCPPGALSNNLADRLRILTETYDRCSEGTNERG